ncbi:MAG: AGE family epimerase/isomerase, partial [Opitutaceae bacterium]|nr:AGE family epimerase/isomerase [Opitutaceae bacterium]
MATPSVSESKLGCVRGLTALRRGDPAPLAAWMRAHLLEHVMPFWERHAFDELGGLATCIADNGRVLSGDKWLWSQWRAVWVFSRIHRSLGHDPRWRERARRVIDFCARTGWDEKAGGWALLLDRSGRILRGQESIYSDGFAIYGLVEFHQATGDRAALELAVKTADAALRQLAGPYDRIPHFPYPIPPGAKPHGLPMMFALILAELGAVTGNPRYRSAAAAFADEVFRDFYRRDRDLVLEFVGTDGSEYPRPQGTAVVPGHVIEDMWFQVHVCDLLRRDPARLAEAFRLTLRHLELGWDSARGGGLLLAVDADGREPVGWKFADSKLWWPQTEALYATLLGWERTRQPEFLDWYERVWQVCLDHFVDWQHGEWRQKL